MVDKDTKKIINERSTSRCISVLLHDNLYFVAFLVV